jgi:phosphoglycerate dehydrogenase-like enzyme
VCARLENVDPRIEVIDGNAFAGNAAAGEGELARAEVALVGYSVTHGLPERAPRLRWVHHTQAGISNLHGTDIWASPVLLTSRRGAVATPAIAEYVIAAAYHFGRGLHEAMRQMAVGSCYPPTASRRRPRRLRGASWKAAHHGGSSWSTRRWF